MARSGRAGSRPGPPSLRCPAVRRQSSAPSDVLTRVPGSCGAAPWDALIIGSQGARAMPTSSRVPVRKIGRLRRAMPQLSHAHSGLEPVPSSPRFDRHGRFPVRVSLRDADRAERTVKARRPTRIPRRGGVSLSLSAVPRRERNVTRHLYVAAIGLALGGTWPVVLGSENEVHGHSGLRPLRVFRPLPFCWGPFFFLELRGAPIAEARDRHGREHGVRRWPAGRRHGRKKPRIRT